VPAAGGEPATSTAFGYDARGNRATATTDVGASAGAVTHTFDLADRLTSVTGADGAVTSYAYDGAGLRASATTGTGAGAVTEEFTWDVAASVPLLLTDAEHAYVYGVGGTPVAQVALDDGVVDYLHIDLLGSVVATADATGQVTSEADYDVYGMPAAVAGRAPSAEITRFGYAGEYADPTGYVYLRARYYDPASAQFLSVDPLVDSTGNPYGYTDGNPLQYTDPFGLISWDDVGNAVSGYGQWAEGSALGLLDMAVGSNLIVATYSSWSRVVGGCQPGVDGLDTALNCIDALNPISGIRDGFVGAWQSFEDGCYFDAGRQWTPAMLQTIGIIAGLRGAASAANTAGDAGSLYRGLAADHPALEDAMNGIARPRGGHADPALHNGGNTVSEFTSWTTDESIARGIAAEANGPGTVLRIPNADGPGYVRVPSPDIYGESEVLIRGPVTGARVLPWEPLP